MPPRAPVCVPADPEPRHALPRLRDPSTYCPCELDLRAAPEDERVAWFDTFRRHFVTLLAAYREEADERGEPRAVTAEQAAAAGNRFGGWLNDAASDRDHPHAASVLQICEVRERLLRAAGIADPYRLAKRRAVDDALRRLPARLAELDRISDADGLATEVVRGVFAGNVFDLGAAATTRRFAGGSVDFNAVVDGLRPRPWRVDELDGWLDRVRRTPHRHAVLFVDNAGPDVLLGMLPLGRWLLQRGTRVTLAANSTPSLNDVVHAELAGQLAAVAAFDPTVRNARAAGRLTTVPSGCGTPLIDLTRVSEPLTEAAADAALLVLEGMGRSIESNYHAAFDCDVLRVAMLKDTLFAGPRLGAELYDLVFRFTPAP